ncbi:MAG: hypothetical protein ACOYBP_09210 [Microbacteriaceae bacterium]
MTVSDLIDLLSEQPADAEVRLMVQPHYPFEHALEPNLYVPALAPTEAICQTCFAGVSLIDDEWHHDHEATEDRDADHEPVVELDDEPDSFRPAGAPEGGVVYLLEGHQLAYGTRRAWG